MKQLSTFLLASLLSFSLIAQDDTADTNFISKGTFELTGGINFRTTNFENEDLGVEDDVFSIGLFPELGYAINDDLVLGSRLGFSYFENKRDNTDELITRYFSIAAFAKKYFPITEKFAFDLQGEFELATSNDNFDAETDIISIGIRPGLNYRLSPSLGFSAEVGFVRYRSEKRESELEFQNSESQGFIASLNASDFRVALTYFF